MYPRREVLDPQAKAIHQALARLGFDDVVEVHAGKAFDIEVAAGGNAEARLRAMCDKLLANPIMERYSIELLPSGNGTHAGPRAAGPATGAGKGAGKGSGAGKGEPQAPGKVPAKRAPAKQSPAGEDATGGTAGGKPVAGQSPGTTKKSAPAAKKGGTKGARS